MESNNIYLSINDDGVYHIKDEYLAKLKELKEQKETLDKELKTLSSAITSEIKELVNETTPFGEYNFIVKGGFYSYDFDLESFKNEHPSLYLQFVKPTYSALSYVLQSASRGKNNEHWFI